MKTVVGLGNYQSVYADTRHNVGYRVLNVFENTLLIPNRKYIICDEEEIIQIKKDADKFASEYFKTDDIENTLFPDAPENTVAVVSETRNGDMLIYPTLGMNSSGDALLRVLEQTNFDISEMIVILDDLDIPLGLCRIKEKVKKSHHNGMRSIIDKLGRSDFSYARIGIGKPDKNTSVLDYVLSNFTDEEEFKLDSHIHRISGFINQWFLYGVNAAMTEANSEK